MKIFKCFKKVSSAKIFLVALLIFSTLLSARQALAESLTVELALPKDGDQVSMGAIIILTL